MSLFERFKAQFPDTVNSLIKARRAGRFAHAYLVHGDSHQLRQDFSLLLSMLAVCPAVPESGAPCGECQACRRLLNSTYDELYKLMPTGKIWIIPVGDRNNPEPNTVRWFNNLFYLTSTSGLGKKIGIIFDADRMKGESQNAFLKTLEEPPPDTMFILTTGNPAALLPTTRSRCQLITLLENHTQFDFPGSKELFATLARLQFEAHGNLALAADCADSLISLAATLKATAEAAISEERKAKLATAEELGSAIKKRIAAQFDAMVAGEYIRLRGYFIAAIHTWFAQVYQLATGAAIEQLANPEIFTGLTIAEQLDEKRTFQAMQLAEELLFDLRFSIKEELALRSFAVNISVIE